jgi:hypothetical protein
LRPPNEFFDHNRISRPADLNQAVSVRAGFFSSIAGVHYLILEKKNSAYRTIPATSLVRSASRLFRTGSSERFVNRCPTFRKLWARHGRVGRLRIVGFSHFFFPKSQWNSPISPPTTRLCPCLLCGVIQNHEPAITHFTGLSHRWLYGNQQMG